MENLGKEPLWTKNFIIVSAVNFLIILIFYLLIVTIAEYAVIEFGASTSTAGLVASIFIIGTLLGRLVTGRIMTSIGTKKTFFVGLVFFSITTLSYFIAGNLSLLMIIRLLHGFSVGVISTATGTVVAQIIPKSRRGEGIGYFSMSLVLASAVGPFIGILLTQVSDDFKIIFIFNTGLLAICIATSMLLKIADHDRKKESNYEGLKSGFSINNYIEPKSIPISFIALIIGFVYSGVMSFLSFYSKEIDLVEAGSLFFFIYAIFILVSRPFTGPLMDRSGANIVVYPALVLLAVGMLLFSKASSSFVFLLSASLIGLGYGNFNSIAQALAIKDIEPNRLGHATTTYFILFDLGLGAGPFLLGYLVPLIGYRSMFMTMVPVTVISIILYAILVGQKEKKEFKKEKLLN
ncbi:MFS transporter [Bacillus sp. Marseille-P3661]|uniref:MFS transporter n=1 Tax=Bacillus sp. Marseille-P3661 TaxID=1936234 RepID=UPI000C8427F9|nr:MFS transporter [Bacillus sp. Marseille-P3661]